MSESTQIGAVTQGESGAVRVAIEQLRSLWKRRYVVLAVAAAVTALTAIWTMRQPKIYEASTTLEFDPAPPRPLGGHIEEVTQNSNSFWSTREYYVTQQQILQSQRVAEAVVRQLGLQHDVDFFRVATAARATFRSRTVTETALLLRERIRIDPVRDSRLVYLRVEDTIPRRGQLIANTLSAVYMRQNLEQKLASTVSALEWLGQQLTTLRGQLEASEMALHEYRQRNNLISVGLEDRRNHVANRIQRLSEALTEIQTRRIATNARAAELRRAANAQDPLEQTAPELLASSILQGLRANYEGLRREREGLATQYGENARQMLAADSRIRELSDAIRREVRNVQQSAEAELRATRRSEGDLQRALLQAQRDALDINLREIEYGRLARERENNAKLYSIVLERTKETDLTRLLRVNNVRVLDDAMLPVRPVKPRVLVNLLAGGVGGLLFGVFVAFVLVQADRTVRSPFDIEEELHSTFLGIIPSLRSRTLRQRYRYRYGSSPANDDGPVNNPDLIVHSHSGSSVAEAYRVIRTNLLFMSPDTPFQTLMVASADPREGKTSVAVSLAVTLAQSGKRVLLIDTDLRRPRVHKAFGVRPPVGITSVLVNEATIEEAVLETEVPNLSILPCGPIPPNPAELLHSQRFQELLKNVKAQFDRVVFDTPPIGAVTDALVIGPQVDGTVVVVRARKTLRARAGKILGQLRTLGARVAGVVLNDVELSRDGDSVYYYAGSYEYRPHGDES